MSCQESNLFLSRASGKQLVSGAIRGDVRGKLCFSGFNGNLAQCRASFVLPTCQLECTLWSPTPPVSLVKHLHSPQSLSFRQDTLAATNTLFMSVSNALGRWRRWETFSLISHLCLTLFSRENWSSPRPSLQSALFNPSCSIP